MQNQSEIQCKGGWRHRFVVLGVLLAGLTAPAQSYGPPKCNPARSAQPHPSAQDIVRTQEQGAADSAVLISREPVDNIGLLRFRIRDYADCTGDSGCYWADLDAQTQRAVGVLEQAVTAAPKGAKLALVLDIDETSLSTYCEVVREDFGYIPDRFAAWLASSAEIVPIPGTVRLVQRAHSLGVAVFFITGRSDSLRKSTEQGLHAAGYQDWAGLAMRSKDTLGGATEDYKSNERKKIIDSGHTIVLNMGDQWNDLQGSPMAQHSVKLPNPFYYLP